VTVGRAEEGPRPAGSAVIADKYDRAETSDLTAEVKAGQKNEFMFDLKP
jgi:hypothetical protein